MDNKEYPQRARNMKTNDRPLTDLMKAVDTGAAQLPDFQRGWVWDDGRIKALILSVIHNFPVGAAMFLEYGNESIHFKHKPIEGSDANPDTEPDELILDGQQRLTSLYNALFSKKPVHTGTIIWILKKQSILPLVTTML